MGMKRYFVTLIFLIKLLFFWYLFFSLFYRFVQYYILFKFPSNNNKYNFRNFCKSSRGISNRQTIPTNSAVLCPYWLQFGSPTFMIGYCILDYFRLATVYCTTSDWLLYIVSLLIGCTYLTLALLISKLMIVVTPGGLSIDGHDL